MTVLALDFTMQAIRYVGWIGFGVVLVIFAVEGLSWLKEKLHNRLAGVPEPEGDPENFQLRRRDSEIRDRYYTDPPKISRDQRSNEPAERARRSL